MRKWIIIPIITLFILSLIVMSQCTDKKSMAETVQPKVKGQLVQVMDVANSSYTEYIETTGAVEAANNIQVVAEESGLFKRLLKDKGSRVQKGDTLAILENKMIEAAFKEASAMLKQAQLDFNSNQVLYGKKAISENDFLRSQYALESAKARYQLAKTRFDKLFIVTPISGIVDARYFDTGAYIMPMSPVFKVLNLNKVKIKAGIAERFFKDISRQRRVEITFDALPQVTLTHNIDFKSNFIDPLNRTFQIEIDLPNANGLLVPNMVANLKIERLVVSDQIVIPLDAIVSNEKGNFVFVVNGEKAQQVAVDILSINGNQALVKGLELGQQLIVKGQENLADGSLIEIARS